MENAIILHEPFLNFLYTFTILSQKMVHLQTRSTIVMNHFSTLMQHLALHVSLSLNFEYAKFNLESAKI